MDVVYWCWLLGLAITSVKLGKFLKQLFFSGLDLTQFKYGWVVITGSTDGIGKAFAEELHRQGFKLILISRSPEKLEKTRADLLRTGPAEVETIAADFSISHKNPEEFYGELTERLRMFEVSFLINNVGTMDKNDFEVQDIYAIENMLVVNLYPMTFLSHALIPSFLARFEKTNQRSFILNISSIMGTRSLPDMAVYAATKAYNDFLSRALSYENEKAITVTSLTPGCVVSSMSKSLGFDSALYGAVPADSYVRDSLKRLGTSTTPGHWYHQIQLEIIKLVPQVVLNFASKFSPKSKTQ